MGEADAAVLASAGSAKPRISGPWANTVSDTSAEDGDMYSRGEARGIGPPEAVRGIRRRKSRASDSVVCSA